MRNIILLLTLSTSLFAIDTSYYTTSKTKSKKVNFLEELTKGEKIKFEPLKIEKAQDLHINQRVVFLRARTTQYGTPCKNFMGLELGNGLFIDGDYNVGISLEKYFKVNLSKKRNYKFSIVSKKSSRTETILYSRTPENLIGQKNNIEFFKASYADTGIMINNPRGFLTSDNSIMGFLTNDIDGNPVTYTITTKGNTAQYFFGAPSKPIVLVKNTIQANIDSDFFRSEVYMFRPFQSFEIQNKGDVITFKAKPNDENLNYTLLQNKDGLYILNEKSVGYRIFKENTNVIHVIEINGDKQKEIMTINDLF